MGLMRGERAGRLTREQLTQQDEGLDGVHEERVRLRFGARRSAARTAPDTWGVPGRQRIRVDTCRGSHSLWV